MRIVTIASSQEISKLTR